MNSLYRDEIISSFQLLAHELGHNFGMSHDFAPINEDCSGSTQIMSYKFEYGTGWSKCSKRQFKKAYYEKGWHGLCQPSPSGKYFS